MPPITLNQIISILFGVLLLSLTGTTWYYHHELVEVQNKDLILVHDNQVAKDEAATKLKELTADRDAKQKALNQIHQDQEIKDAQAQTTIKQLHDQLLTVPIRVQYITRTSTSSGSSSTSNQTSNSADSAGDSTTAYGVLSDLAQEQFAGALSKVETLSAAYNSCRATLYAEQ